MISIRYIVQEQQLPRRTIRNFQIVYSSRKGTNLHLLGKSPLRSFTGLPGSVLSRVQDLVGKKSPGSSIVYVPSSCLLIIHSPGSGMISTTTSSPTPLLSQFVPLCSKTRLKLPFSALRTDQTLSVPPTTTRLTGPPSSFAPIGRGGGAEGEANTKRNFLALRSLIGEAGGAL